MDSCFLKAVLFKVAICKSKKWYFSFVRYFYASPS